MDYLLEGSRRSVNLSTFLLRSLKVELCDFGGKITLALEPFQNKDSSLVLLLLGTVNGELKIFQNCSKTAFEVKGQQHIAGEVIQRLFIIDLYT